MISVINKRKQVFSKEFMKKNFEEIHKKEFPGESVPAFGFPDNGNGLYS